MATIRACLSAIGVTSADSFTGCVGASEEFSKLKKLYFRLALDTHPDKGGDPDRFREVQEAWEALRVLYDSGGVPTTGFAHYLSGSGASTTAAPRSGKAGATPSWDWFATAADEEVPTYRVELAKSGRSQCKATGAACKHGDDAFIEQGSIRFGSMDEESGTYGRWRHLSCWRVPYKIWSGLPDPAADDFDREAFEAAIVAQQQVSFCGFTELSAADQQAVVDYMMDKANWAKKQNKKNALVPVGQTAQAAPSGAEDMGGPPGTALVAPGGRGSAFVIPKPGVNGALAGALTSKTFVLTGIFPELGGGAGLDLGKARCTAMIESFGGRVTSSVSGKTDYLVVGKEPGQSKVSQATSKGIKLIDILGLKTVLESGAGARLESAPEPTIGAFSAGYKGKSHRVTDGTAFAPAIKAAKPPKPPKPPKAKAPRDEAPEGAPAAKKARKAPAKKKIKHVEEEEEGEAEAVYVPKPSRSRAKRAE